MKKYAIILLAIVATVGLYAADNVSDNSGAVRNFGLSRWQRAGIGNNSPTVNGAVTVTNLVTAYPSIIGKVILVPSSTAGDKIEVFDASSKAAANCTAAQLAYVQTANSPTMANSSTVPFTSVVELNMPCTNGIVTVSTVPVSGTANKAWLLWDRTR